MTTAEGGLLAVHLAATGAMAGLIWFVQLVHYPLFDRVGPEGFAEYERQHQQRTSWVVGPFMAIEGVTAMALLFAPPEGLGRTLPFIGLMLLSVIHLSTLFLQVPLHSRLTDGHDPDATARLVSTNWIRTVGWSLRALVAIIMITVAV